MEWVLSLEFSSQPGALPEGPQPSQEHTLTTGIEVPCHALQDAQDSACSLPVLNAPPASALLGSSHLLVHPLIQRRWPLDVNPSSGYVLGGRTARIGATVQLAVWLGSSPTDSQIVVDSFQKP